MSLCRKNIITRIYDNLLHCGRAKRRRKIPRAASSKNSDYQHFEINAQIEAPPRLSPQGEGEDDARPSPLQGEMEGARYYLFTNIYSL